MMKATPNCMDQHVTLPPGLDLKKASFYGGGLVSNVKLGTQGGCEYAAFDYDPATETANMLTVVALRIPTPTIPITNLSRTSGIQLERVGEWILAFEPGRWHSTNETKHFVDEVQKLLEYAKAFPQNM